MKTLGVLGGLGPMATAYFLQLLTQMSDAAADQEHMEIVLYSKPAVPDRTKFIIGESSLDPVPDMVAAGLCLKEMGADLLAIPCITAHYFHRELEEKIGLPVLHAIEDTVSYLQEDHRTKVGILATDGTIKSGLFQDALDRAGIAFLVPDAEDQKGVMDIIYRQIKAGKPVDMALFGGISKKLIRSGAQTVLLACTELSLIKRDHVLSAEYLDVMEVLARRAVLECGRLRSEYQRLGRHTEGADGLRL